MSRPYDKPFLSVEQALELLQRRGMVIDDRPRAADCLHRIGYYRLSAYWYPFRKRRLDGQLPRRDDFLPGTNFAQVMDFYIFDKKLRLRVSDAVERIEIAVRAALVEKLGERGAFAYRDPGHFNEWFTTGGPKSRHARFIAGQDRAFDTSHDEFAKHFRQHYSGPAPVWIASERWNWGNIAFVYRGLNETQRRRIAADLHPALPADTLDSWLAALNDVRNACAHHRRLWNAPLVNSPSFKGRFHWQEHFERVACLSKRDQSAKRLYGALLAARFLLRQLQPESRWHRRLIDLIDAQTLPAAISETAAGFPAGWRGQPVWA